MGETGDNKRESKLKGTFLRPFQLLPSTLDYKYQRLQDYSNPLQLQGFTLSSADPFAAGISDSAC